MRSIRFLLTVSLAALAGCGYESPQPISPAMPAAPDSALLGLWVSADPEPHDTATLAVMPLDSFSYLVEMDLTGDDPIRLHFRVHLTRLNGFLYANALNLEELGERKYAFARLRPAGADWMVEVLKQGPPAGMPLRDFLRTNPAAFDEPMRFRRLEPIH